MKRLKYLLIGALLLLVACHAEAQKRSAVKHLSHIKCHYFFEEDGQDGTFDGKPLLDKHNNVTLAFSYNELKNVKLGDTIVLTYYTMPHKWVLDTDAKNESCFKCNSAYFEQYKMIVTKKY